MEHVQDRALLRVPRLDHPPPGHQHRLCRNHQPTRVDCHKRSPRGLGPCRTGVLPAVTPHSLPPCRHVVLPAATDSIPSPPSVFLHPPLSTTCPCPRYVTLSSCSGRVS